MGGGFLCNIVEDNIHSINYLCVNQLHQHIIEAEIATGSSAGRTIFIPRITHITQENEYPFEMRGKKFPIKPAFAVTANKSQGQTFERIGVYLPNNFFSHRQRYMAMSRIGSKSNLKIMAPISNYDGTEETLLITVCIKKFCRQDRNFNKSKFNYIIKNN